MFSLGPETGRRTAAREVDLSCCVTRCSGGLPLWSLSGCLESLPLWTLFSCLEGLPLWTLFSCLEGVPLWSYPVAWKVCPSGLYSVAWKICHSGLGGLLVDQLVGEFDDVLEGAFAGVTSLIGCFTSSPSLEEVNLTPSTSR